jgi:steroid 5-alpha reductase family enzyme
VTSALAIALGAGLVAAALVMLVTAVWARRLNRVAVVDVAWGLGFVVIALVAAVVGTVVDEGDPARRWLLVGLVVVWGGRLAWHIGRRAAGHGEDPRYVKHLGGRLHEVGMARAVRKVFLVQGLAIWLVSTPVMVGAVADVEWWPVVAVGTALWLVGLVFEAVGDAQLAAYQEIPKDERPQVLDRGLWGWTRHPNYFGDASVAWGLWLVGAAATGWLPALLTVVAPLAMTYFLVFATGARLLERTMMQRPGYPEYAARTSMFFPRPPRGRRRAGKMSG